MGRQLRLLPAAAALAAAAGGAAYAANAFPPIPIGVGPKFRIPGAPTRVLRGLPTAGFRCGPERRRIGVHLELFARRRVLIVPPGIGVAAPRKVDGAFVRPRGCTYPIRTVEPTGIVEIHAGRRLTLGDFFDVWGQPLSRIRLATFRTSHKRPVRAYVGGRRWRAPLRAIPLRRHAQIVLELGPYIRPHPAYPSFPRGL